MSFVPIAQVSKQELELLVGGIGNMRCYCPNKLPRDPVSIRNVATV